VSATYRNAVESSRSIEFTEREEEMAAESKMEKVKDGD
jgi:hypothetical protein